MNTEKYSLSLRILHWGMALILLFNIVQGFYMDDLPKTLQGGFALHKSLGVLILLLVSVRLIIRIFSALPPLPGGIPVSQARLAKTVHWLMYLLMAAIPVSGWLMSNAHGRPVLFFSLPLPNLVEKDKALGGLFSAAHEWLAITFLVAVGLHLAGFIYHLHRHRLNLLRRMA